MAGCGYWGPNLARNFRSLEACRVPVVCDTNPERLRHLRSLYPEMAGCTDYAEFLNYEPLEAVAIATPVRHHYWMAKAALEKGKHTLIEKPMASSLAECQELLALARRQGVMLMVGHTFLYAPAVRRMKEILAGGEVGDIRYICSRRLNLGLFQNDINVTWDLAPHDLSIILHLVGEPPQSVACSGAAHVNPGVEDVAMLFLKFSGGRCAIVHNSWLEPRKVREMTIVGSRKMIVYDDVEPHEKLKIYDKRVEPMPHYDTFADFHYAYHYGENYAPYVRQEEPLKLECQHFAECIRSGCQPLTDGQHGAEIVAILEAAQTSLARHGQAVPCGTIAPA